MYPRNDLYYARTSCTCSSRCRASRTGEPGAARAIDLLLILHADHEQNASTSTVRLAGSTGANPFACIAAGIASLWGPAHGGANEAVLKMLDEIGHVKNIPDFLENVRTGTPRPADGLRPSRLQELRSAREDHPEGLPRGAAELGIKATRCSISRWSWRRSR